MEVQWKRTWRRSPPGPVSVLTIVLPVLKLTGVIGWSWWVVLLPLWGPAAVVLAVLLPFVLYSFVSKAIDRMSEWMVEWRIRRLHAGDNPELWL